MKIKQLAIKHPELGEITIHSKVPHELMQQVGTVVAHYSKINPFFSGRIWDNEDGSFTIQYLRMVQTENIGVGEKIDGSSIQGGVTMITNKRVDNESDRIKIYPSGVLSVITEN